MKDRKQRRTLSGAVLIMVLTVMFVLIILLMATLTVVTTANQRIYTKFEENQAYYTARSALDVYLGMLGDKTYQSYSTGSAVDYTYGSGSTGPMKQGLALQLDLYSLEAKDESGTVANFMGNIPQSALQNYANTVSDKVEYKTHYGAVAGKDKIVYQFKLPEMVNTSASDTGKKYGRFVDVDDTTNLQEITITVQVLERTYSFGGDISTFNPNSPADAAKFAEAMVNGDRTKDSMRLKITSEATFIDTVGTAVLVCNARELPAKNNSKALTAFSGSSVTYMNVVDGFSAIDDANWSNGGSVFGNIYAEKNFDIGSTIFKSFLTENESFFIGGKGKAQNSSFKVRAYGLSPASPATTADKTKRPFIYVGSDLYLDSPKVGWYFDDSGTITAPSASDSNAVDLLTNGLYFTNDFKYNGDIYCKGLCNFTGTNNIDIYGDVYIDGQLAVNTGTNNWQYDTTNNKLNVPAGVHVYFSQTSQIVTGSSSYDAMWQYNGFNITDSYAVTGGNVATYGYDTFNNLGTGVNGLYFKAKNDPTELNKNTADDLSTDIIEVKLPNGVEKKLPTTASNYNEYYKIDSDGDFVDSSGSKTTNPADYVVISAEEYAFTTRSDLSSGKYSNKEFTTTDVGTTATLSTATRSIDTSDPTVPTKYTVNPTGALGSAAYGASTSDYLHIFGGGTVEFLLVPDSANPTPFAANILVDDDTTLKIYIPQYAGASTTEYYFHNFKIWNNDSLNAYNGAYINVGSKQDVNSCHITVPRIYYYVSSGVNVTLDVANDVFLTGYLYGPGATIKGTNSHKYIKYNFNGENITPAGTGFETFCIGSVLCNDLTLAYPNGVAYINPDLASSPVMGDPPLRFESYHYERK